MIYSEERSNQILGLTLGKVGNITAPKQVWGALSTTNPETEGFTEVTGNGYGRILLSVTGQDYPNDIGEAEGKLIENKRQLVWPRATGAYDVKGIGLFEAETGGSPYAWGALTGANAAVSVVAGALPMFDKQAFNLTMP